MPKRPDPALSGDALGYDAYTFTEMFPGPFDGSGKAGKPAQKPKTGDVLIIGIGGTFRPKSSTELVVQSILNEAEKRGARTEMFDGQALDFPIYGPDVANRPPKITAYLDAVRRADAIVIGSPGYHGSVSGLIKNALDYIEDLSKDDPAYLAGKAVGCAATGFGWQGANAALTTLRQIAHALRGWPAPMGITINSIEQKFSAEAICDDEKAQRQIAILANDLVLFARKTRGGREAE
ncbi:MAG: NADPH-dependent FMN reductase [Parvularculaceae bacterium]